MDIICEDVKDFKVESLIRSSYVEMSYFHYHSCYELFIIISGERKMILQDKIYQGCGGDIFLIPPQYIHRTKGAESTRILIDFTDEYLNKFFAPPMITKMLQCFDVFMISVNSEELRKITELSEEISELSDTNHELCSLKLAQLLLFLSDKMDYDVKTRVTSTSMQLVSNILSYINSNYKNLSNIKKISDKFYISEEYLCRIFKKHTGVTVVSYLNSLKLKASERLLSEEDGKNIAEISEECGFSSPAYFGKLFKKNYGASPIAYRDKKTKPKES